VLTKKDTFVPTQNNILVQADKIFPTTSPYYGVNPSVSTVLEIFSKKRRNGRMKHVKM
jgi:hypothetical protein